MILAEKIVALRKKINMTQEDLAEELGVSRQSISKWEGSLSTPDLNKIIAMAKLFGVTTDFLLDDDISIEDFEPHTREFNNLRQIDLEQANNYIVANESFARWISTGVLIIILSLIAPVLMDSEAIIELPMGIALTQEQIGAAIMFALMAIGVVIIIWSNLKIQAVNELTQAPFELAYGVRGALEKQLVNYRPTFNRLLIIGIGLIFLAIILVILFQNTTGNMLLFLILAFGVSIIIYGSVRLGKYQRLLESNEKSFGSSDDGEPILQIFWLLVIMIFLGYSLITNDWGRSWIIWPISGFLYAILAIILRARKE